MDVSWSETCPRCRYPLPAWDARCPECGLPPPGKERGWRYDGEHDLLRVFCRRAVTPILVFVITLAFAVSVHLGIVSSGGTTLLGLAGLTAAYVITGIVTVFRIVDDSMSETRFHRAARQHLTCVFLLLLLSVGSGSVLFAIMLITKSFNV